MSDVPDHPPMKSGLVLDPLYVEHETPAGHPERPERYETIVRALRIKGLIDRMELIHAHNATEADLATVHPLKYIKTVKEDIRFGHGELSTGDTMVSHRSLEVALRAAGGACAAVDTVLRGKVRNAFCVVRPPGHHATPVRGMGFCIFNNIAVAARHAQKRHGVGKILIVDWDVHHGNGTQDAFYADDSVLFFSVHQHPWYPNTGRTDETGTGRGLGYTINVPLPAGSGRRDVLGAFQELLIPAAQKFRPELVMISAGFDSREGDPLGRFTLGDYDFTELTEIVMAIAHEYANDQVVSVLEGGYDLSGLASATVAHVRALINT